MGLALKRQSELIALGRQLLLPSPQELGLDVPCNFPELDNLLKYIINNAVGSLKTSVACEFNMSLIYIESLFILSVQRDAVCHINKYLSKSSAFLA